MASLDFGNAFRGSGTNATAVFVENGLSQDYGWTVTFGGVAKYSNFSTIFFSDPPGIYNYTVASGGAGYTPNVTSGTIDLSYGYSGALGQLVNFTDYPPGGVGYNPSNGYLYVSHPFSGNVSVIQWRWIVADLHFPTENISNYAVAPYLEYFAYDSANHLMYAAGQNTSYVYAINGTTVQASMQVGGSVANNISEYFTQFAGGIAYNPSNGYIYVTHPYGSPNITLISGTKVIANISVGADTSGIAYDSLNGYMYVSTLNPGGVLIINGTKVVGNISLPSSYPESLGVNQKTGWVYATDLNTLSIHIITGTTLFSTIGESSYAQNVGFDPMDNLTYITTQSPSDAIQVWNDTNVVNTIPGSSGQYGIAFDGSLGSMVSTSLYTGFLYTVAEGSMVIPISFTQGTNSSSSTSTTSLSTTTSMSSASTSYTASNSTSGSPIYLGSPIVVAAVVSGVVIGSFGVSVIYNRRK